MAASVFDSALYAQLFGTGETGRLFTDSAAVRAMLLVEGALAKVQGAQGVIPELSAAAIHRASLEIAVDPGALAVSTGQNGVAVPGLVAADGATIAAIVVVAVMLRQILLLLLLLLLLLSIIIHIRIIILIIMFTISNDSIIIIMLLLVVLSLSPSLLFQPVSPQIYIPSV